MAVHADIVMNAILTPAERAGADVRASDLAARHLTLQQLRKARELTQAQLARTLGKEQVTISQMEKRTDMLLSTLRSYIEAMGGNLSLVVQFDDRAPVFLAGLADEEPLSAPSTATP